MRYRLRWRFDFLNRPSKFGQWDRDADRLEEKACYQNREGLIRASIEGKNWRTYEVKILAECDGWDFINFAWRAEFRGNAKTSYTRHTGLELWTRDIKKLVLFNGNVVEESRVGDNYHYATFGR